MGRQPKGDQRQRTVQIRVLPETLAALRELAAAEERAMTVIVRDAVDRYKTQAGDG